MILLFGDQAARMFPGAERRCDNPLQSGPCGAVGLSKRARLMALAMLVSSTALMDLMETARSIWRSGAPAIGASIG